MCEPAAGTTREDHHTVATFDEFRDNMPAKEPRATCNDDLHRVPYPVNRQTWPAFNILTARRAQP